MSDLKTFILTTLSATGGSAALLAIVTWLGRSWITERLRSSIRHEYDLNLAKINADLKRQGEQSLMSLKAEIDRQTEKMRISATSFTEVQKATIARKIAAVDALWLGVLNARKEIPSVIITTDILTDSQMESMYKSQNLVSLARDLREIKYAGFLKAWAGGEVENFRPHLGEYTWALYAAYHSILGRSFFLISDGKDDSSKIHWYEDSLIRRMIESAFGEEKFQDFLQLQSSRYEWLSRQFELLLFQAIDRLLTGKAFSDAALFQAQAMEVHIRESHHKSLEAIESEF